AIPESSEDDIKALEAACTPLSPGEEDISIEWLDGYMTALAAGPYRPTLHEWVTQLRQDLAESQEPLAPLPESAMTALAARWKVLQAQLDPQALMDGDENGLRLQPLILTLPDDERERLIASGELTADDIDPDATVWASGFMAGMDAGGWPEAEALDGENSDLYEEILGRIIVLTESGEDQKESLQALFDDEGATLTREDLIDSALFAVQDARLLWLSVKIAREPITVAPTPGRNDPCSCGSGKKYKKCCGA
ncbi:UPF0149 family protein, partial [Amphibiibacter pelophylacis]